jgi:sialate O-acetylesterase
LRFFISSVLISTLLSSNCLGQVINLEGSWRFHIGDQAKWAAPEFNDSDWELIKAPAHWEDEGFNGYDGFAWYRITFDGRWLLKTENYYLNLGYIDDSDEVYLNGRFIGFSGSMPPKFKTAYNSERKYSLLNEYIDFSGENTIAVRVFDVTLGGGIFDGDLGIYRAGKSRMLVDLQGLWDFSLSLSGQNVTELSDWTKIMVPGPWEHQGYHRYDGFAWYKRSFSIPDRIIPANEPLVLILGKIDDFDDTYLNGKLIGRTNDRKRYGSSTSYDRLRVYDIPSGLLKKGVDNVIEIMVEDMGNVGGIYEGPIGITTKADYERYFR